MLSDIDINAINDESRSLKCGSQSGKLPMLRKDVSRKSMKMKQNGVNNSFQATVSSKKAATFPHFLHIILIKI